MGGCAICAFITWIKYTRNTNDSTLFINHFSFHAFLLFLVCALWSFCMYCCYDLICALLPMFIVFAANVLFNSILNGYMRDFCWMHSMFDWTTLLCQSYGLIMNTSNHVTTSAQKKSFSCSISSFHVICNRSLLLPGNKWREKTTSIICVRIKSKHRAETSSFFVWFGCNSIVKTKSWVKRKKNALLICLRFNYHVNWCWASIKKKKRNQLQFQRNHHNLICKHHMH